MGDPLAFVFQQVNLDWIAGIVAISAVIATASVILVFQVGQPRIWMAMSRDGLLPAVFSKIHPRFKTPSFSTILTGVVTAIPALFLNLKEVIDLTSVGTLFAFVLVCGGIMKLQNDPNRQQGKFKVPYVNARFIMPALLVLTAVLLFAYNRDGVSAFFSLDDGYSWEALRGKVPYAIFSIVFISVAIFSFLKNLSLIPALGFLSCTYLLCESGATNWERFLIWLLVGFAVYFLYGYRRSKLKNISAGA